MSTRDENRSDGRDLEVALQHVLPRLAGAFSLVLMDEAHLFGVRDRNGFRPLVLGRTEGGWVLASETAALDIVGAHFVRDVEPGELVAIDASGVRSLRYAEADPKLCLFEFVYIARPDTHLYGQEVHAVRQRMGEELARQAPCVADMVMPVPESGVPAAQGYARASGIPYGDGFVKNRYVGRTFIQPSQKERGKNVRLKLNPLKDNLKGKRVVVVEDSIVRGTTTRQIIALLREAGATEVHFRVSSPPYRWPCFYGLDTASAPICSRPTCRSARSPTTSVSIRSRTSISSARSRRRRRPASRSAPRASAASTRCRFPITTRSTHSRWRTGPCTCPAPSIARVTPDEAARSRRAVDLPTAGVDIAAGEKAVERIKDHVRSTFRREVVGDLGGFGGLFALDWKQYHDPLLVSSTDGVGTKSLIARLADRRDTIGIDCVAMSVDDIAAQGAEPLFFLDYISVGHLVARRDRRDRRRCRRGLSHRARCALLGGEMSEHPGLLEPGEFDLVGFAVGVVDRAQGAAAARPRRRPHRRVREPGSALQRLLTRRAALLERGGRALDGPAWAGAHHDLAEELLRPSVIYAPAMLRIVREATCTRSPTSPAVEFPATSCGSCPTDATP